MQEAEAQKMANDHVDWFVETLRPILKSHFLHGFKHGAEWAAHQHLMSELLRDGKKK
jgi:hypothetical protein